ncbi:MAG TPA: serine/threonine-protein kinase [Planosporangium sp.]|nr:serine/threonine-protein kinase [Planosporangium sp.]
MSVTQPLLAERYRLVRSLGQGGMGRVWLARDEVLHRDVAIKEVIPPEGLTAQERDEMRRRTLREARAAARLNHPSVVRVYDVVRTDVHPWIVMEYVASRSLHQVISEDGTLPPARVAQIGLQVLGALRAAHNAGVLHRDVKPSNVLLTDDGRVVLTDFGLATMAGEATVTRPGMVLGSPAYIAPERARQGITGPESDLWSLGATLYAAVEGSSPYHRSSAIETLTALVTEEPPPARNAGPLRSVLNGLLRKDPASRIDAETAERLLRRAAGGGLASRIWMVPKPRRGSARAATPAPVPPPSSGSTPSAAPAAQVDSSPVPQPAPQPDAQRSESAAVVGPATEPAVAVPAVAVPAVAVPAVADPAAADPAEPAASEATAVIRPSGSEPTTTISRAAARPWSLAAAAVLALVLVAGIVALSSHGGNPDRARKPAAPTRTPAAAGAPPGGPSPSQGGAPTGTPGQNTPAAVVMLPGWQMYTDPTGFSVAAPIGWTVSHEQTMIYFRDPNGGVVFGIDQSNQPHLDPVADWTRQEGERANSFYGGYQRVRIEAVRYFIACADWEFTYDQNGTRAHVINRGFVTSDHQAYGIWWSTPESSWQENRKYFELVTSTFKPKP